MIYCKEPKKGDTATRIVLSNRPELSYLRNGDFCFLSVDDKKIVSIGMEGKRIFTKYILDLYEVISNTNYKPEKDYHKWLLGKREHYSYTIFYGLIGDDLFFTIYDSSGHTSVSIKIFFYRKNLGPEVPDIIKTLFKFFEERILKDLKSKRRWYDFL